MPARPRIDLDGVSLVDKERPPMVVAVFRYRTSEGLVLLVPESADVLVPWGQIEEARLDLASAELCVRFVAGYVERQSWLRGARTLVGTWTDRFVMHAEGAVRME